MKSSDSDCRPEREPQPNDFPLIPNAPLPAGNTGGEKQCALVSKHLNIVGSGELQVRDRVIRKETWHKPDKLASSGD